MFSSTTPPVFPVHRTEQSASKPPTNYSATKLAYSIKEACAASSLGRTTIYAHIAAGRLRAIRIGGRTVIPADSLHALVGGTK